VQQGECENWLKETEGGIARVISWMECLLVRAEQVRLVYLFEQESLGGGTL